jgi:SET family sugar efflux transporter-like MFS transporter
MRSLAGNRSFVALATAVLLLGIGDSMAGSYLVLFLADARHLTAVQIAALVSAPGVGGIALGWLFGRGFDRRPGRTYAALAALAGALGFALLNRVTSFPLLVLFAIVLLGAGTAGYPQLFALARVALGRGTASRRSAPLLRSAWSLAWAIGPLAGAATLAGSGYTMIFWCATAALTVAALTTLAIPRPEPPASDPMRTSPPDPPPRAALGLLTCGVALFFTAMFAGSVALPLYVTRTLHEGDTTVGLLFSACSAVEVVAALGLACLPERVSQPALIVAAMGAFVGYFALTAVANGLELLLAAQVARGVAITVVGAAGLRYFQDLMTAATGRATTLFANASTAGSLLSGVLAGVAIEAVGASTTLVLCGVTALLAAAAFTAGARLVRAPVREPVPALT